MRNSISSITVDDYLQLVPDITAATVRAGFATDANPNDVVHQVAAQPGEGLSTRGDTQWPIETFRAIVKEIHLAICTDDPKYAALRSKVAGEAKITAAVIVNMISSAIAAAVHMLSAMCLPMVALVLAAISKIGVEGWCTSMKPNDPEANANPEDEGT